MRVEGGGVRLDIQTVFIAKGDAHFSAAALLALLLTGLTAGGWSMYAPPTDADSVQFLSNGQFSQLGGNMRHNPVAWIIAGGRVIIGVFGSVVACRRGLI